MTDRVMAADMSMYQLVMQYGLAAAACIAVVFLWKALQQAQNGRITDLNHGSSVQNESNLSMERLAVAHHASTKEIVDELRNLRKEVESLKVHIERT